MFLSSLFFDCRKARRKEKADVAGVTGGSSAGLGGGGLGLAGTVSLPVGNGPSTLGGGLVGHTGAHGQYGDAEHKLYLESTVLERKVPEADLRQLIDLPPGLDLNEWLASHSKLFSPLNGPQKDARPSLSFSFSLQPSGFLL